MVDVQNDFISGSLSISNCPAGHNGEEVSWETLGDKVEWKSLKDYIMNSVMIAIEHLETGQDHKKIGVKYDNVTSTMSVRCNTT